MHGDYVVFKNKKAFKGSLADGSDSIDKLNNKFGVKGAKSVFFECFEGD